MEKISLHKEFGKNILTRSSMDAFFKRINSLKDKDVILDFKNIHFISRSSAAEYIKQREETNKNLIEKNMSNEVKSMFYIVVKQLKSVNFNFKKEILIGKILKP